MSNTESRIEIFWYANEKWIFYLGRNLIGQLQSAINKWRNGLGEPPFRISIV